MSSLILTNPATISPPFNLRTLYKPWLVVTSQHYTQKRGIIWEDNNSVVANVVFETALVFGS